MSHHIADIAAAATFAAAAAAPQAAQALEFSVEVNGTAQVVEVVDAQGPVLRFQTQTTGNGSFGIIGYTSTDVIDMASGQGSGSNRFVTAGGDELLGTFSVQVLPTGTPGALRVEGITTFSGGTGQFAGATGNASFTGVGNFVSQTQAVASFVHQGSVALVPEPSSALMLAAGLAGAAALQRRRRTAR